MAQIAGRLPQARHKVALLAYDRLSTFEFACAAELLRDRSDMFGNRWYRLSVCTVEAAPLRTDCGLIVPVAKGRSALENADTIVVPGWRMDSPPVAMLDTLVTAHRRGARIASICTGSFVLAAAGLLDGRQATTHWRYAARLAAEHPNVRVDPSVLYVDEGDVVTSAGSAAGIDMLLHLVRKDFGVRTCNAVARTLVVPPHRSGGQAQFIERPVPENDGSALAKVIDYLRRNASREHCVADLASKAAMSPRTFYRRFRESTGHTPYDWLLHERVAAAKTLLEETAFTLEQVAHRTGFGAVDTLRHHFGRIVGMTPTGFRERFSRTGAELG